MAIGHPPQAHPSTETPVADASFVGGLIVGVLVGAIAGAVLTIIGFMLWYNAHCGQVPLFGGSYCR